MVRKFDNKRTKIVCTIGPSSSNDTTIREMIRAGMDVARINFSHGTQDTHRANIERVRRIAKEEDAVVAILGDLQGPKIRIGQVAAGVVHVAAGDRLTLTTRAEANGTNNVFRLPHPEFVRDVKPGHRLLLDDGALEFKVVSKQGDDMLCEVVIGGPLSSNKGVSAPEAHLTLSALTKKDREDAAFAIDVKVDYLAMSFVRSADDMRELRWLVRDRGGDVALVAKIEKREAILAIEAVINASDGIMVARGDLGVETPAEEVPIHQKEIIRRCNAVGKPVITATQMLQSMIDNPRPTRAEASDVANAIWDGTDAVMLSGETASGHYPIESVQTMATIAHNAEAHYKVDARRFTLAYDMKLTEDFEIVSDATSRAAVTIAQATAAKLIITSTLSGYTSLRVARERPETPILSLTPDPRVQTRMALVWGVLPMLVPEYNTVDEMLHTVSKTAYDAGLVKWGDLVVVIAGVPFGAAVGTNFLKIHRVGELGEIPEH